jgi:3-phenylpropionate/trans-cinnamate dioxygenase ferredoxin component
VKSFVEVAKTDELADGAMKQVSVGGREIFVARVGDRYYSADNRCPHMGGNLSQGTLEGTILTCPRHHSQFDLTDGHVVRWTDWTGILLATGKLLKSPRPIRTHPVREEGGSILVGLES